MIKVLVYSSEAISYRKKQILAEVMKGEIMEFFLGWFITMIIYGVILFLCSIGGEKGTAGLLLRTSMFVTLVKILSRVAFSTFLN